MGILLAQILNMDCFAKARIHSGMENMENTLVSGITIVERPDIANWIKGGELLLTSFYSIENDVSTQIRMISDLSRNGAAGLVVKVSDLYPVLARPVIDRANELGFPLLEIPPEVKYIDILYPVMEYLLNDQVVRLNYYKTCHIRFNQLSLAMKGIDSISRTLAEFIEQPVLIFDTEMRVLSSSDERFSELNIVEKNLRRMVYEGNPIFSMDVQFQDPAGIYHLTIQPIEVVGKVRAYLGIIEIVGPLKELDYIALETAANTLRLEVLKDTAVNESQLRYKGELLDDIVHQRYQSERDIYDRGNILGWDLHKPYLIAVVKIQSQEPERDALTEWLMESRETVKGIIDRIAFFFIKDHISLIKGEELIVFWPVAPNAQLKNVYAEMKKFGAEVRDNVTKRLGKVSVLIGIGGMALSLKDIGHSYFQAKDAVQFGDRLFRNNDTVIYDELGLYKILCSIQDRESLVNFVPESLLKLREYDKDKNNELIDTLERYLESNLNAVRTSEKLFVHYKTVLYRLSRIREITSLNLEDRDKMLEIEMGIKILKLVDPIR